MIADSTGGFGLVAPHEYSERDLVALFSGPIAQPTRITLDLRALELTQGPGQGHCADPG